MSNHIHLLIGTPESNLGDTMRHLLTESSRRIARASGRINRIFGARHRWSILYSPYDYAYVYKYVYRNPVRASICPRAEDYPFSTLNRLLLGKCEIPICERLHQWEGFLPKKVEERLAWLNQPTPKEAEELIGRGLRRFEFHFTTDNAFQKQLRTLKDSYGIDPK